MNSNELPVMRFMTREGLSSLRRDALRRRVWYRVLTRLERSVVELTVRCVDRVQSGMLALVIGRVVCKLLKACRSQFLKKVNMVGAQLAERVSRIAVSWGYVEALDWKLDSGLIRFLGVTAVNNPPGWRVDVSS